MEHVCLSATSHDKYRYIVPYIASDNYKDVPFLSYIETHGLQDDWHILEQLPQPKAEAIYQSWYFFCFLQEVLGDSFKHDDFVKTRIDDEGIARQVVTTANLSNILQDWIGNVDANRHKSRYSKSHLETCFMQTRMWQYKSQFIRPNIKRSVQTTVSIVISVLADTLGEKDLLQFRGMWHDSGEKELIEMTETNNWCRYSAERALNGVNEVSSQMFIRSIVRPFAGNKHSNCSKDRCDYAQIVKDEYTLTHAVDDCRCDDYFSVDPTRMQEILEQGHIPILEIRVDHVRKARFHVKMIAATAGTPYIAISHVWADGMGNPLSNSLRECRVLALCEDLIFFVNMRASAEVKQAYFWLDTLCVPVEPMDLKRLAMSRMKDVYRDAEHVLVYDSELQATIPDLKQVITQSFLISTSQWMWRLWTCQEALLATNLWFNFAMFPVSFNELYHSLRAKSETGPYDQRLICKELSIRLVMLRTPTKPGQRPIMDDNLLYIHQIVKHRALSVQSDEALCLATLAGVDIAIDETFPGQRMSNFWKAMQEKSKFSASIIFSPLPRLEVPGFGWAPSTLLHQFAPSVLEFVLDMPHRSAVQLRPEGLETKTPSMIVTHVKQAATRIGIAESMMDFPRTFVVFRDVSSSRWLYFGAFDVKKERVSDFITLPNTFVVLLAEESEVLKGAIIARVHPNGVSLRTVATGYARVCTTAESELMGLAVDHQRQAFDEKAREQQAHTLHIPFEEFTNDRAATLDKLYRILDAGHFGDIITWFDDDQTWVMG